MPNFWDKPNKAIEKIVGDRIVFYSVDADMNKVAIKGKAIIDMPYDEFWGEGGKPWQSETLENPTWLELAVLADEMIRVTDDLHHVFLENIYPVGNDIVGVPVYKFSMGS